MTNEVEIMHNIGRSLLLCTSIPTDNKWKKVSFWYRKGGSGVVVEGLCIEEEENINNKQYTKIQRIINHILWRIQQMVDQPGTLMTYDTEKPSNPPESMLRGLE